VGCEFSPLFTKEGRKGRSVVLSLGVTSAVLNPGFTTPDEKVPKYCTSSSIT
jgi:hypothetical protein